MSYLHLQHIEAVCVVHYFTFIRHSVLQYKLGSYCKRLTFWRRIFFLNFSTPCI